MGNTVTALKRCVGAAFVATVLGGAPVPLAAEEAEALLFDATGDFASRDCRIQLSVFSFFDDAHVDRLEGRLVAIFRDGRRQTWRFAVRDLWPKSSALADPVLELRRTNCQAVEYLWIRSLDTCLVGGSLVDDCLGRSAGSENSSIPIRVGKRG